MDRKKTPACLLCIALLFSCNQDKEENKTPIRVVETKDVKFFDEDASIPSNQINHNKVKDLERIFFEATSTLLMARPVSATSYGVNESDVGGYFNNRLPMYDSKNELDFREKMAGYAHQLHEMKFENSKNEENRLVMTSLASFYAGNKAFDIGYVDIWMGHSPFIVNQINGPAINMPGLMINSHSINNLKDAKDYLKRLEQFGSVIESVNKKVLADAESDWVPPKVIINGAVNFLNGFTRVEPKAHSLVTNFESKIDKLNLEQSKKNDLLNEAIGTLSSTVYPAYVTLAKTMQLLSDKGRIESGIWAQPNGDAYYAEAVRQLGDTDLSPNEIHEIGLAEVERITKQMDSILSENGYTKGTVGKRMAQLNDEPRFLYEDSDEGRQQLLADLNAQITEINERMPEQFATVPPYDVEVRRIPVERQDGAPGGQYTTPSLDGSQPGIYWINLRYMKANPKFDLKTLTYHEANPGHHWQIALNMAQDDLPLLRRLASYNAYIEGWALYSELVAWEMGMYENDPFGDLGRLKAELFRAVRLVVDTGLHAKKWTREEAIKYMTETTGNAESAVVTEIERYMTWPGQALGYKLGMINLVNQRERARKVLGDKFDPKEFHDLILLGGAVPMSVLNKKIDSWLNTKS